tara:strand:- start:2211 stop:5291 length:3081 start_codon:yes stop_codon:yes gene_type:complete
MSEKVKVVLLAGRGIKQVPKYSESYFSTSLEWLINAFNQNGIDDITIVGGKGIESIELEDMNVKYIFNPSWDVTGPVRSLFLAKEILCSSDCLISYVDVVYRAELVKDFLVENDSEIRIVTDKNWKERYLGRTEKSIEEAEKVWLETNNTVSKVDKKYVDLDEVSGEYTGLLYLSKDKSKHIFEIYDSPDYRQASLTHTFPDFFQTLLLHNQTIQSHNTLGEWAELDKDKSDGRYLVDFNHFIFGTKAQTLTRLKPMLKKGKILTQVSFTIYEWEKQREKILKNIQGSIRNDHVVVRSSTLMEDSLESSYAGQFTSKLNVPKEDAANLTSAIEEVIESYGQNPSGKNQILVQPQIVDVKLSGVVFTCDIRTGAPYYTINYSLSGDTDLITAGYQGKYHLAYIYRHTNFEIDDYRLNLLRECGVELENLTGNSLLDIEFAFDDKNLYVFQARPITSTSVINNFNKYDISEIIESIKEKINIILEPKPSVSGKTTILGDMPDWNPAELIGSKPRPLAISLFDYLITRETWRLARKDLYYFNPRPERLLVSLGGHPYIDVRNSLNSLTPSTLKKNLRDLIVNESLNYLKANPDSHDKLEFEVASTCFSPLIDKMIPRWEHFGLTSKQIDEVITVYREHTNKIMDIDYIDDFLETVYKLDEKRNSVLNDNDLNKIEKINLLIEDCTNFGTRPFSSLARLAFIGKTFLKGFLDKKIISKKSYDSYLASISTVATKMSQKIESVKRGDMKIEEYLEEYGHLRPGTWDITSHTYIENPDLYFDTTSHSAIQSLAFKDNTSFHFSNKEKKDMGNEMSKMGIDIKVDTLLDFIIRSIEAREYSKFLFSRNISEALTLICEVGENYGFNRSDLSYLEIETLLTLDSFRDKSELVSFLNKKIDANRKDYLENQQIIMPSLICSDKDVEVIEHFQSRANYITSKKVIGQIIDIDGLNDFKSLDQKIVMIESADPGYDWVFTHNIKGIITKYGGAASHMAIRSSEFNLPAAIGVGQEFDNLKKGKTVILDCENKRLSSS